MQKYLTLRVYMMKDFPIKAGGVLLISKNHLAVMNLNIQGVILSGFYLVSRLFGFKAINFGDFIEIFIKRINIFDLGLPHSYQYICVCVPHVVF